LEVVDEILGRDAVERLERDAAGKVDQPIEDRWKVIESWRCGIEWLHGNAHFRERSGMARGGDERVTGGMQKLCGGKADARIATDQENVFWHG
jgi:hypothetical protein